MNVLRRLWQARSQRRKCFHHDMRTGETWISSGLVDLGRRKLFVCSECGTAWIF